MNIKYYQRHKIKQPYLRKSHHRLSSQSTNYIKHIRDILKH